MQEERHPVWMQQMKPITIELLTEVKTANPRFSPAARGDGSHLESPFLVCHMRKERTFEHEAEWVNFAVRLQVGRRIEGQSFRDMSLLCLPTTGGILVGLQGFQELDEAAFDNRVAALLAEGWRARVSASNVATPTAH